jgi:hypothetical protein
MTYCSLVTLDCTGKRTEQNSTVRICTVPATSCSRARGSGKLPFFNGRIFYVTDPGLFSYRYETALDHKTGDQVVGLPKMSLSQKSPTTVPLLFFVLKFFYAMQSRNNDGINKHFVQLYGQYT